MHPRPRLEAWGLARLLDGVRSSIAWQVVAGLGVLGLIATASVVVLAATLGSVRSEVRDLTFREQPQNAAAYEMEINVVGYGQGVLGYLSTGSDDALLRVEDDRADFLWFRARYGELAFGEERELGEALDAAFARYDRLGVELIDAHDEQSRLLASIEAETDAVDQILDEREDALAPGAPRNLLLEVEVELAEVAGALKTYERTGSEADAGVLDEQAAELLERSRGLSGEALVADSDVEARVAAVLDEFDEAQRLERVSTSSTEEFLRLRNELDALLDEEIQALVAGQLKAADRASEDAVRRTFAVLAIAGPALLLGGVVLALVLVRTVRRPLLQLLAAAAAVRAGDLSSRLSQHRKDEFGAVARDFNAMVDQLERTAVSKATLEHSERELRALAHDLEHQATHDALTGLPNRRLLEAHVVGLLDLVALEDRRHALCYLDLDQFNVVNDILGHAAGDDLLRQLGGLLRTGLREGDLLARLGGDEFGLVLENCPLDQAAIIAEELRGSVEAHQFTLGGRPYSIRVSIGLAPLTADFNDVGFALAAADRACQSAKEKGRNRVQLFAVADEELTRRHTEMQWAQDLVEALDQDRFELWRQPIVPLKLDDGRDRFEVLLRLRRADGELVPPGEFLPAAERYGLMPRLDRWVVAQTLADVGRLYASRPKQLALCTVNLSGATFSDAGFLDFALREVARSGLDPRAICFEITETAAVAHFTLLVDFVASLQARGCRFALDDLAPGCRPSPT